MFDSKHYVPILKGKLGELEALRRLEADSLDRLTPVIETDPNPPRWDPETYEPREKIPLDEHLERWVERVLVNWGTERTTFIDPNELGTEIEPSSGLHCAGRMYQHLRAAKIRVVPVARLTGDIIELQAARDAQRAEKRGVCIRATGADLADPGIAARLHKVLAALESTPARTDLIVDFGAVTEPQEDALVAACDRAARAAAGAAKWRTLTVAATSFPNLSKLKNVMTFWRIESRAWSKLAKLKLPRVPTFGDFGVQGYDWPDNSRRAFAGNPCIRYTADGLWLIARGGQTNQAGVENATLFRALAKLVVAHDLYHGKAYSWGDARIAASASGKESIGGATKWRAIGTNQHLRFVTQQLATTGEP